MKISAIKHVKDCKESAIAGRLNDRRYTISKTAAGNDYYCRHYYFTVQLQNKLLHVPALTSEHV